MAYLTHKPEQPKPGKPEAPAQVLPVEKKPRHDPSDYGSYYYCVKSPLSEDGDIYTFADEVRFTPTGGVLFLRKDQGGEWVNLAIAPGQWKAVFSASCWDGSAVAVEHWRGEVVR